MANLTRNTFWSSNNLQAKPNSFGIADAVQLYVGEMVDKDANGNLIKHVAGGLCYGFVDRAGMPGNDPNMFTPLLGEAVDNGFGTDVQTQAIVEQGSFNLLSIPVTGATWDGTAIGTLVYGADSGSLTTTQTGGEKPIGQIIGVSETQDEFVVQVYDFNVRRSS